MLASASARGGEGGGGLVWLWVVVGWVWGVGVAGEVGHWGLPLGSWSGPDRRTEGQRETWKAFRVAVKMGFQSPLVGLAPTACSRAERGREPQRVTATAVRSLRSWRYHSEKSFRWSLAVAPGTGWP